MNTQPYLQFIKLLHIAPCLAEPGKFAVTGKPSRSLAEVLPYLAALPNVIGFNPQALRLAFRRPRGFIVLCPSRISITQVRDADEGQALFTVWMEAINDTWENRSSLRPVQASKKPHNHLDIYALLPQTNCRQCGETSCRIFAVGLAMHKHALAECRPLQHEPAYLERKTTLESLL